MVKYSKKEFLFGGDYNPDQWNEDVWDHDLDFMHKLNVNTVTLPVFSWANLQPAEDEFNFGWLDKILEKLSAAGIGIVLATPTAAQPAWMSKKYPDVLPVNQYGLKQTHGSRCNFCPTSTNYRRLSAKIAETMALRYKHLKNLRLWHINNEYGPSCYCEQCAKEFRMWLKNKYSHLSTLNEAWLNTFWGHTITAWDEIFPPTYLNEVGQDEYRQWTTNQPLSLDYNRFMSESILNCFRNEANVIRKITPNVPITTNLMSTFKPLNYFEWAKEMDIVSWDNYPHKNDPVSQTAMRHDLMRGVKSGMPFLLMEQTPNQQNWMPFNTLKRPGEMRLMSYQAVAHGADSVLFFQWRQSRAGHEKLHAAMVPHAGHLNTRIGRELQQLGLELPLLKSMLGARVPAKAAILFDWENWWALENSSGPSVALRYKDQILRYYQAFYENNIMVDLVHPDDNLDPYQLIVAPVLYMCPESVQENLKSFVHRGGTLLITYFSGIVDERDHIILGGYPGALRDLLGIWVEESDALYPQQNNTMQFQENALGFIGKYSCSLICDVLHLQGAKALARFGLDYYAGFPCFTENDFGKGKAYYLASQPEADLLNPIIEKLAEDQNIQPVMKTPHLVEAVVRETDTQRYLFVLNYNPDPVEVKLPLGSWTKILWDQQSETLKNTLVGYGIGLFVEEKINIG